MAINYAKTTATTTRVKAKHVPMPQSSPLGRHKSAAGFAHVSSPKTPANKSNFYTKAIAQKDPSEFVGMGFGNTGMTGES